MFDRRITLAISVALASAAPLLGEIESELGARDFMIATDHSSPEQIGPLLGHHHDHPDVFSFSLSAGADSRYVSEGRDNLDREGGILWANAIGHYHALGGSIVGEVTGITAWEADYEELGLTAGYEFELGSVTLSAAATYLWFPEDDEDDVELAIAGEWSHDCGFGIAAEAVWSTEAEGWFGEMELYYEFECCEHLVLTPSVFLGVNQGYVSDEHDGFNHIGAQLAGSVPLSENIEASAYVAFIRPLRDEMGESLRDLFWFGGAVSAHF